MMNRKVKLAPSILSADFSRLGEQIVEISKAGIDYIHVDVMDGHFVPNITIGPVVLTSIKKLTSVPLDVHLMIENPMTYIKEFRDAGADIITVHVEAESHIHKAIDMIHGLGCKAGVSLNPSTGLFTLDEILPSVEMVLIMSVNPGFGGQKFINSSIGKIERLRQKLTNLNIKAEIEVDGGITAENVNNVIKAGADVIVAGYAIFSKPDITEAIRDIKKSMVLVS
jgi:ribulose-phosphate 3-epimerase